MEVGINPPPQDNPVTSDQERELLRSPTPVSGGEDKSGDEKSKALDKLSLKRKRLGGAARRHLSRLLKGGTEYDTALKIVIESHGNQQLLKRRQSSSKVGAGKRVLSDDSTPEQRAKMPREGECTSKNSP